MVHFTRQLYFYSNSHTDFFLSLYGPLYPSIPTLIRTSSFRTQSILVTPTLFLKHFISRTFTNILSALLITYVSGSKSGLYQTCHHLDSEKVFFDIEQFLMQVLLGSYPTNKINFFISKGFNKRLIHVL